MLLPESLKLHNKSAFDFHYIYFLPWKDQMVQPIEEAGGQVTRFSAKNNLEMLLQYQKIIQYCKNESIELIHCHLPWSGFLGRLVHKKTGIPVIYTEHNIQEKYHIATKTLNKITFNSQSLAIGVSEDVTRSIHENIDPIIPVQTVLNGVNTEFFSRNSGKEIRANLNIPSGSFVIGNIAVFREQKALLDWVRTFDRIQEGKTGIYGILVGAGPQEEAIKGLIRELHLEDKIKMPGLQTDTVGYFSAMDIFLMSSAFEGLPIALLEAMSMECAVVSTKAGGVVEVVEDNKSGLLCEVGDWKSLGDKVNLLIENRELRLTLQQQARKRIEEKFSLRIMVQKLEDIYLKYS